MSQSILIILKTNHHKRTITNVPPSVKRRQKAYINTFVLVKFLNSFSISYIKPTTISFLFGYFLSRFVFTYLYGANHRVS